MECNMEEGRMTVDEVCSACNVSRQAVRIAIKKNSLRASYEKSQGEKRYKWFIRMEDLKEYRRGLYSRDTSVGSDGNRLYDEQKAFTARTCWQELSDARPREYIT
jgi:Helix-turn-helix domain